MGLSAMPLLRFGRDPKTEALQRRVSNLQTALKQCGEVAGRWTEFRRGVTAAIAVLMLTLGFAAGVYREPISQFLAGLPEAMGLASPAPSADDAFAAYQKRDYATVLRLASQLAAEGDARSQFLLGLSITAATAYRGIIAKQQSGFAELPTRAKPMRNFSWG